MKHIPLKRVRPRPAPVQALEVTPEPQPRSEYEDIFKSRLADAFARAMREDADYTVSARVPRFLFEYIEEFAQNTKRTKQEVLQRAICCFIASHPMPKRPRSVLLKNPESPKEY